MEGGSSKHTIIGEVVHLVSFDKIKWGFLNVLKMSPWSRTVCILIIPKQYMFTFICTFVSAQHYRYPTCRIVPELVLYFKNTVNIHRYTKNTYKPHLTLAGWKKIAPIRVNHHDNKVNYINLLKRPIFVNDEIKSYIIF